MKIMKKFTLKLAFALSLFGISQANAQLNQDVFGYKYLTNKDSAGPSFKWVDISQIDGAVTVTGLGDDNGVGPFNMGFPFKFYFGTYSDLALGVNGWMSFSKGTVLSPTFPAIPTAGGKANNFVAPFLADLNFAGEGNPGNLYYWSNKKDTFIVTYDKVPFWVNPNNNPDEYGTKTSTFQVIFSNVDSSITLNYLSVADSNQTASGFQAGMENISGQIGLKCLSDLPKDSTAIKFYYPEVVTAVVNDAAVNWNENEDNGGFFVVKGTNKLDFKTNIINVGNVDAGPITITGKVRKGTGLLSPVGSASISSLAKNTDSTVTIVSSFSPTAEAAYTFEGSISSTGDQFTGNNKNSIEFNVVSLDKSAYRLTYTDMDKVGDGVFGLSGSNTGSAVLIVPPIYPAIVTKAEFYPSTSSSPDPGPVPNGFRFYIYANNGENGSPGALLYSDTVLEEDAINVSLNTIALKSPLEITSGGVYLFFFPDSNIVSIQTDGAGPYSFRTFEAIGGQVSPYRGGDASDFKMGLVMKGNAVGVDVNANSSMADLSQNAPNPAKLLTNIQYSIPSSAKVEFIITNMLGKVVNSIELGTVAAGKHQVQVNTSNLSSGLYFYSMIVNGETITRKMIVNN